MKKSYYAVIPADVRYDRNLAPNAKLLYGEITALCNEKGYCFATNAYFAELYGVSQVSVSKWVSSLCELGYINVAIDKDAENKDRRKIYIVGFDKSLTNAGGESLTKVNEGSLTKVNDRLKQKFKHNNTVNNNFIINNKIYSQVITFLNEKTGKRYNEKSAQTRKLIDTRIKEGFTVEDFENVITNMASHWLGDEKMEQYLRPQTLFGTKFESYLNTKPKKGAAKFTEREYTEADLESKIADPLARYEKMLEGIEW